MSMDEHKKIVEEICNEMKKDVLLIRWKREFAQNEDIVQDEEIDFDYKGGYQLYKKRYEIMQASTFWKMTEPIRGILDRIKGNKKVTKYEETKTNVNKKTILKKKIAVWFTAAEYEKVAESIKYLNIIPESFDIVINGIPEQIDNVKNVLKKLPNLNDIVTDVSGNTLMNYELVLYISPELKNIERMLESEERLQEFFAYLNVMEPRGGLIIADFLEPDSFLEFNQLISGMYVEGSCWIKTLALKPLLESETSISTIDWSKIYSTIKARGYVIYIYNATSGEFLIDKSSYALNKYYTDRYHIYLQELNTEKFGYIVFDVFDVLIDSIFYNENDMFRYIERFIEIQYGIHSDFLQSRINAENSLERGKANLNDIYRKLASLMELSDEMIQKIKTIEMDIQLKCSIPRKDGSIIYKKACDLGKRILIINNSFFSEEFINSLLTMNGYLGKHEILSADMTLEKQVVERKTVYFGSDLLKLYQYQTNGKIETFYVLPAKKQYEFSQLYSQLVDSIEYTVEDSIILGYCIKKSVFNSWFVLNKNGYPKIETYTDLIEGFVAPLFLGFMDFLEYTNSEDQTLLFLAREGYFLQKLYEKYCKAFSKKCYKHVYFLASRRATSIPQIENYQDIKELLKSPYTGKLSTLFYERFGLEYEGEDIWIYSLKEQLDLVLQELLPYIKVLIENVYDEKTAYFKYIKESLGAEFDWNKATIVDVGYSGSIQYYMMKMLKQRLKGNYLVLEKKTKPDRKNGICIGFLRNFELASFSKSTLLLESIATAPHGQVIRFHEDKKKSMFVELKKEDKQVRDSGAEVIYKYIDMTGNILKDINPVFSKQLVIKIFDQISQENFQMDKIENHLSVNDEYCNDGVWRYNEKTKDWKLGDSNDKKKDSILVNTKKCLY